jgi:subtilisin family serine protease
MTSIPPEHRPAEPAVPRFGSDLPPDVAMSPAGDYLFRAGELLIATADLDRVPGLRDFMTERGRIRQVNEQPVSPTEGVVVFDLDGIERHELQRDRAGRPAQQTVALMDEIEARFPDAAVELNYVYLGSQSVMGGPATVAEPSGPPQPAWLDSPVGQGYTVGVLDTGIVGADGSVPHVLLDGRFFATGAADEDRPAEAPSALFLDRQGGHGTFVAGVVRKIAPGARIAVGRVLRATGEGDIHSLVAGIGRLRAAVAAEGLHLDVLNLSLGGYTRRDRPSATLNSALAPLLRGGTVVVAAAGNNASWRPFFPAALPQVVGVGALDGRGPATFTNYGPWVDACAVGVDVVSTFFDESAGELAQVELPPHPWSSRPIPARFPGFARWSGTSFASPAVAGAIVAAAWSWQVSAADAAARLVRDWHRYRLPDLGVVVNAG